MTPKKSRPWILLSIIRTRCVPSVLARVDSIRRGKVETIPPYQQRSRRSFYAWEMKTYYNADWVSLKIVCLGEEGQPDQRAAKSE